MKLTEKKSIELTIEQWTWLAETGKEKGDWPGWESHPKVKFQCFLCERTVKGRFISSDCPTCPYCQKFGQCIVIGSYYNRWEWALTARTKKKYAKLFLEQLKQLEGGK